MKQPRFSLLKKLKKKGFASSVRALLRFVADRAAEIEIGEVASSMALATLLAIVPVLALSLAVFAAFPSFADTRQALESLIETSFLPQQYSDVLVRYLKEFTSQAAGLTTFGLLGLGVTTFMLIDKLFITVNRIFKSGAQRPLHQRVLIYWALMTFGPIFVALSLTLTGKAASIALSGIEARTTAWLIVIGQLVLQSVAFAVIYKFIPRTPVQFTHALVGGSLVALIGQVVKQAFELYVSGGTMSNIYGAFVAVPVLILWIYISWLLFFTGAAVTATIPKLMAGRFMDSYRTGNDFVTGLVMLKHFVSLRLSGVSPVIELEELCDAADTYPEAAERILDGLYHAGYVAPLSAKGKENVWVLVADSQKATLMSAFEWFCVDPDNSVLLPCGEYSRSEAAGALTHWWEELRQSPALHRVLADVLRDDELLTHLRCRPAISSVSTQS